MNIPVSWRRCVCALRRAGFWGWFCSVLVGGLAIGLTGCGGGGSGLVVYCAQDQVYAEPLFREFERRTGIGVKAVFDSELVKTVGMANRLLAEAGRPICDVYWSNEELRTRQLQSRGVFASEPVVFGGRSRRLVYNTAKTEPGKLPGSLLELTNAVWRGRVAVAYPVFGTTAAHFLVLRERWGEEGWRAWCAGLVANGVLVVDGNSAVVRFVARGHAWVGLTDSDDVLAGVRNGEPVGMAAVGEETLWIPNTAAVVSGKREAEARRLIEFLSGAETIGVLVGAGALEAEAAGAPGMRPDWTRLVGSLEPATRELESIFVRR